MRRKKNGFSLLEVLIVTILLIIVSIAVYLLLFNASATYTNETQMGDIQERARRLADDISKELRGADTSQAISLLKPASGYSYADFICFRVPKRVDATSENVIWSDADDSASMGSYNAVSPYPPAPCVVCYRLEDSLIDSDGDLTTKEKRLVRVIQRPGGNGAKSFDLTPPRVLSDFIKAPAAGTGIFKRGNDDTIEVILTFITLDFSRKKAKALETSVRTSVSMRNKAIP